MMASCLQGNGSLPQDGQLLVKNFCTKPIEMTAVNAEFSADAVIVLLARLANERLHPLWETIYVRAEICFPGKPKKDGEVTFVGGGSCTPGPGSVTYTLDWEESGSRLEKGDCLRVL
jgi:hypothetical protein